ncbi:MAG TPA: TlpA disulfide reductase family protein [Longimicrobiales bacterium]
MGTKRNWPGVSLEAVLWIAVLGFVGYRLWPQAASALGLGGGGTEAPDIRVETLAGDTIALRDLRGQVVLVNFWATWCPPCRYEMPGFQRTYERYRDRGFTILGLSTDRAGRGTVQRFLDEMGITYPVAVATAEAIQLFGAGNLIPASFLIDTEGRIRYTVKGVYTETALTRAVERLLREGGSKESRTGTAVRSASTAAGESESSRAHGRASETATEGVRAGNEAGQEVEP